MRFIYLFNRLLYRESSIMQQFLILCKSFIYTSCHIVNELHVFFKDFLECIRL